MTIKQGRIVVIIASMLLIFLSIVLIVFDEGSFLAYVNIVSFTMLTYVNADALEKERNKK